MTKSDDNVAEFIQNFQLACKILDQASKKEFEQIIDSGCVENFLNSIFTNEPHVDNVYEYLLENKNRAEIIARIWYLIIKYPYILKNENPAEKIYVSPHFAQWFDEGIMLTIGDAPFRGPIALYKDGEITYAVAARQISDGEKLGPKDLKFITPKEAEKSLKKIEKNGYGPLEAAIKKLEQLLEMKCEDESEYQSLLEENPWMFGATYDKIDSHIKMDDKDIPDFTGIRVRDNFRDIIEIKQPFLKIFRNDGKFSSDFHQSFDQTERYLDFANTQVHYLDKKKGLKFQNPQGYILMGYDLDKSNMNELRRKERARRDITCYTYEDLLVSAKATIKFFKNLSK